MFMFSSSQGKSNRRFQSQSEFQMFSLISDRHVGVPRKDTDMASVYSDLYKIAWNVSANNSRTVYCTDLRLGEVFFDGVTVKTGNTLLNYRPSQSWPQSWSFDIILVSGFLGVII